VGFGITNLIARPSPGIDDLTPDEYLMGWKVLDRKIGGIARQLWRSLASRVPGDPAARRF
jgi:hypothetical protein